MCQWLRRADIWKQYKTQPHPWKFSEVSLFFCFFGVFFSSLSWSFTWHILAWSPDERIHWCDKRREGNVHKDTYTYCALMRTCTGNPRKHHRCGTHAQHIPAFEQAGGVKFCFCAPLLSVQCSLWQRGEGGDNDSLSAAARELALNQNTPGETGRANGRALGSVYQTNGQWNSHANVRIITTEKRTFDLSLQEGGKKVNSSEDWALRLNVIL